MPGTTADFIKGMIATSYEYALEKYEEVAAVFSDYFEIEDSKGSYEEYTSFMGPGDLTETEEGEEITSRTAIEGFTVTCANRKFTDALDLASEAIEDHRHIDNFLKTWAQGLGESAIQNKERRHANLFNYGGYTLGHSVFNNATKTNTPTYGNFAYDAKPAFNLEGNERTAKHGGTYYNAIETLNLNETNLQTLYQLMTITNAYNEAGLRVSISPTIILVQLGSDNWFTARRIIESPASISGTHSGVENLWKRELKVIGNPFLTNANAWFLGIPKKGTKSLARKPLFIDYFEDKKHDAHSVRGITRYGCCFNNFRYWVGANILTA